MSFMTFAFLKALQNEMKMKVKVKMSRMIENHVHGITGRGGSWPRIIKAEPEPKKILPQKHPVT